jgi:mannose-1-phosphate guanylyltransferase/phosphomannomutase
MKKEESIIKAIIMAGGEGSRLRPLTCDRPKPMVPVANKPVITYAIELLKKHGVQEIGVTLQYLPQAIMDYFGDGQDYGVKLHYFIEETPLGTAGSVKNASDFLTEPFFVVSGDALTDFDLSSALAFHRQAGALATLVLTTVENPLEYGVVITETNGKIKRFLEKPGWSEVFSDQVNTGIYILEPEVLDYIPSATFYDFSKNLFPLLLSNKKPLFGTKLSGYWCDIGNLDSYLSAHHDILAGRVKINIPGRVQDQGIWLGENCDISLNAIIEGPVLIGDYCRIEAGANIAPFTVIGNYVSIKEHASIKRSVIWNNVSIERNAALRGALVGQRVIIEANAAAYEGATIGDGSRIQKNSLIKPGIKIWPEKIVESGTRVSNSLIWGNASRKDYFGKFGVSGVSSLDLTPEFCARLGSAYGTVLPNNSAIAVSAVAEGAASMLKNAVISGLQATGVKVFDYGELIFPVHCYGVQQHQLQGSVHLKQDTMELEKYWIQFTDSRGIKLTRGDERKIESILLREEYRYVPGPQIQPVEVTDKDLVVAYQNSLLHQLDRESISRAGLKIVVAYPTPQLVTLMNPLWDTLSCQTVIFQSLPFNGSRKTFAELHTLTSDFGDKVVEEDAWMGVALDHNGENFLLIDERGQVVDAEMFSALISSILFATQQGGTIVVPITASQVIEKLAERYQGQVIRAKTDARAIIEKTLQIKEIPEQTLWSQIYLQYDRIYTLLKLIDFLVAKNLTLSEMLATIPTFYFSRKTLPCPWNAKGKVMRTLIEEEKTKKVELLDGIKVYHQEGWTLVLPHTEEPAYHIYGESFSQEAAEELTNLYEQKIKDIIKH